MKKFTQLIIFLLLIPILSISQASLNMVQIGNLSYNQDLNDIWGYVDDDGNEHALVGCANGFSYVDISNPSNPEEVFFISGSNSVWRDLKTWNNYAYVTTEAADGLLIVDLDDLSGQTYTYWTDQFMRAHNIYIDENGFAYIFGSQDGPADGAIILDLNNNPMNPSVAGLFDSYYLHDGMVRGDTLWGSAIYEGVVAAIDVSDKANPVILGSTPTSCNFTHNAWVSDDGNYVFTTDEQQDCNIGAYDVSNISDIQEIDLIQSWNNTNSPVIPHNTHVLGNYLVTSYYTSGVTVVDASDPYNLVEIAYYDTSPDFDGGQFEGCWGAYPFLPSGLILASDQQTGLHILEMSEPIYGCTNEDASNYNPDANTDDGSCLILGCTDPTALNYNPEANVENNDECEYLCDQYFIAPPAVIQTEWIVNYGESLNLEAEADGEVFWLDNEMNVLSIGSIYNTNPIVGNTTLYVFQQEIVEESVEQNVGELNHICGGGPYCDYSGGEYNSYLIFDSFSPFILNSVKVYASQPGNRTIELRSSDGTVLNSMVVFVPESEDDGYVLELNWNIDVGQGYQIGTNTQMNIDNYGENNPGFKRTTLGQGGDVLTSYPYVFEDVVSINNSQYGTEYYYYFYDWEVQTEDKTCNSPSVPINITLHSSSLLDDYHNNNFNTVFDLLGRKVDVLEKNQLYFKLFDSGIVKKEYSIE